ncbi:hypothetical protein PR048_004666 [Dryococelus australis]|uniref:Uncharacterized protein n=1 Tax=Dryococelus australis TaxID=614101 RepID=A0ABQ9I7Y8_9NEOP|nr:hypothetical protein PR048_004666 [Dryococelus australis]
MNLPIMDGKRKKRKKKDSTIKSTCVPEEPKFRRRSDSSSTNPVIVVEGEVLPRRASFSELARSYSSSNERTIVCIKEQEGVEHNVEACNVPDEINYVVVSDQGRITGVCNSANCVDSKRRVDSPGSLAPVNIVVEGGGERTSVINKEAPKMGSSRTVNGTNVQPRRLSSPSYMKTALSARNSRKVSSQSIVEPGQQAKLKSDNWRKLYRSSQLSLPSLPPLLRNGEGQTHTNGNADSKEMHRFSSSVDVHREHSARKGGGGGGLKKMVKRFFE